MFGNQKTPLWDECNEHLEHLQNVPFTFNDGDTDLLYTMGNHMYAMLAVAKEKGDKYLITLKYLYLAMMRSSLFDNDKHPHHIMEILSGNIEEKAKVFFANEGNLIEHMSEYLKSKLMDCLDEMSHLLTNETCFKYLLESCKKNPGFVDDITAKIFCLSLISKCPNLDTVGKYSPYALKCAMETFKNLNPEEEMPKEMSYHDLVSNQVVVIDSGAFMSDIGDVMRKCLNEDCVFSE